MVEDLWVISISCVKDAGEEPHFESSTPRNKLQRWNILWLISHNLFLFPLKMGKLIFRVTVIRWVLLGDNNEQGIDFTIPQEWRITPFGWGTVLEIIKGILSPSDSTKTQLLYTMKEGNQWDRKRLCKTTEASSFSLHDCQILPNAGLYWIKYSLSLLWPLSKSNSLYWALGAKHLRTGIPRYKLESLMQRRLLWTMFLPLYLKLKGRFLWE